MDSTMKIKNNNNLKEFSILTLRNNLYFNHRKAWIVKDITEEECSTLEMCSYCNHRDSSFHSLVLCTKVVKDVWEFIFEILKKSGYNFEHISKENQFFNFIGNPNGFPFLIILSMTKLIYLLNCNKTPVSTKIVKNNLIKLFSIQLEIHKTGNKRKKLNRIWDSTVNYT